MAKVSAGYSGPPISAAPIPGATTLTQMVQPWVDALNDLSSSAQNNLNLCTTSLNTFQNNCKVLVGDNDVTFQGMGATAFEDISTLNQGQSMLVNAKMNDFYNASTNLASQITNLTSPYELNNGPYDNDGSNSYPNPVIYQFSGNMGYPDMLNVLMDSFISNTSLDSLLNLDNIHATVSSGTQPGLSQLLCKIETKYQELAGGYKLGPTEDPNDNSRWKEHFSQLKKDYQASQEILQGMTTNMNSILEEWAMELCILANQYAQDVTNAAQTNQPTVGDYIYEASLPNYTHQNVLIWPLEDGSLFIMVKGGSAQADEQIIKNYLATYGQQGKIPLVTIMGYENIGSNGLSTAQQIIDDAQGPNSPLGFQVVNAIMAGEQNDLPNEQTPGINYIEYGLSPQEKKAGSFLGLNGGQTTSLLVTTIVALAFALPEGGIAKLADPKVLSAYFAKIYGKVAPQKMIAYAVALGYDKTHKPNQTPAEYLMQWAEDHNQDQIQLPNGQWISMKDYVQQQISRGSTTPLSLQGVNHRFQYEYTIPEEVNMQQNIPNMLWKVPYTDLTKSSYLGSQFILDPNGMNQAKEGVVTLPPITNLPPGE